MSSFALPFSIVQEFREYARQNAEKKNYSELKRIRKALKALLFYEAAGNAGTEFSDRVLSLTGSASSVKSALAVLEEFSRDERVSIKVRQGLEEITNRKTEIRSSISAGLYGEVRGLGPVNFDQRPVDELNELIAEIDQLIGGPVINRSL